VGNGWLFVVFFCGGFLSCFRGVFRGVFCSSFWSEALRLRRVVVVTIMRVRRESSVRSSIAPLRQARAGKAGRDGSFEPGSARP
jgi:hypothetical protein